MDTIESLAGVEPVGILGILTRYLRALGRVLILNINYRCSNEGHRRIKTTLPNGRHGSRH